MTRARRSVRSPLGGDPADPTPLHFKLRTVLREAIDSLAYAPGSRLPPEREMATLYHVSRITVRQALDALAQDGLIVRSRGRSGGTFVRPVARSEPPPRVVGGFNVVVSPREFRRIAVDAFDVRACNANIGAALRLPADTPVRYVERRIFGAAGPVAFVRNFLPLPIGERLSRRDLRTTTLYELLTRRLGIKIAEVDDEVQAVLADTRVAPRLEVRIGVALLSIRRTYLTARSKPVNLTILMTPDRYRTSVRLRGQRFD
jgi:GntR family transcriptional regulator